jgi:hypothetical protein
VVKALVSPFRVVVTIEMKMTVNDCWEGFAVVVTVSVSVAGGVVEVLNGNVAIPLKSGVGCTSLGKNGFVGKGNDG